jgi:hypothetical protein
MRIGRRSVRGRPSFLSAAILLGSSMLAPSDQSQLSPAECPVDQQHLHAGFSG